MCGRGGELGGGVKKWLWSEKKIIVRSGSSLCLHDDDEPASAKRGRLRLGDGGGGGLATVDPRLRDMRGSKGGGGGDNPNKHLEDILPSAPKLITVPRWH